MSRNDPQPPTKGSGTYNPPSKGEVDLIDLVDEHAEVQEANSQSSRAK